MPQKLLKAAGWTAALLLLAGCAAFRPAQEAEPKAHAAAAQVPQPPAENSYYLFTEAMIHWKRGDLQGAVDYLDKALEVDPGSVYLLRQKAVILLQRKETDKALAAVEQVLEKHPDDVGALTIFGRIQLSRKNFKAAESAYIRLLQQEPDKERTYLLLGGIYRQQEQWGKALDVYSRLVKAIPESYAGYYYLGQIYAAQGRTAEAEQAFLTTLDLNPDLAEPRFALIDIYKQQGRDSKVVRLYQEILDLDPDNVKAILALSLIQRDRHRLDQAQTMLSDLGAKRQLRREVLASVLREYLDEDRHDDAIFLLKGLQRGDPSADGLLYLTGLAYDGAGKPEEAIAYFRRVDPDSRFYQNAVIHITFLYREDGRTQDAVDFLSHVVERFPDNPEFLLHLGTLYESSEEYGLAESCLKRGLAAAPDDTRLHFRLGVVYDKWGRKQASIEQMKEVIRLDPKHANALNYLGYTYADMGVKLDEAERLIKEALKYKPDDGYITDSLGWVYYQKGLYEKSLRYLKRAVELVPDDPVILEHLGDVHLKLSDREKALEYYRRSLNLREKDRKPIEEKIRRITGGDG